jgi:single-stranded DNA-binding protein
MQDIVATNRRKAGTQEKRFMLGYTKALQGLAQSVSSGSQVLVNARVESVNWHHKKAVEHGVDPTLCSKATSAVWCQANSLDASVFSW